MDKSIAFIFIGTNKYIDFFPAYYNSVVQKFARGIEKHFIVFTNNPAERMFEEEDITAYYIEHQEWPHITLKRFEFIMKAEDQLKSFSDIIFMDADMEVNLNIPSEFLDVYEHLFGVHHPGQYMYGAVEFETDPKSKACVTKPADKTQYRQGCLWGGKNPHVLEMIEELKNAVQEDLDNGIIAAWHDESHLNRFFSDNEEKVVTLNPGFAYPEMWELPLPKFIIHKDKSMTEFPRFRGGETS